MFTPIPEENRNIDSLRIFDNIENNLFKGQQTDMDKELIDLEIRRAVFQIGKINPQGQMVNHSGILSIKLEYYR